MKTNWAETRETVRDQVWCYMYNQPWNKVMLAVRINVYNRIMDQVWFQVWNHTDDQIKEEKNEN
jgi:hypothetical protein